MPTEKGLYVLNTDASVVAISGILHQEEEWNGRTVLRPIAYGSKVLSETKKKYEALKATKNLFLQLKLTYFKLFELNSITQSFLELFIVYLLNSRGRVGM